MLHSLRHLRFLFLLFFSLLQFIYSQPLYATEYSQWVEIAGADLNILGPATVGRTIAIYHADMLCGQMTISPRGSFAAVRCPVDDPATAQDEGIGPGEALTIRLNGQLLAVFPLPLDLRSGQRYVLTNAYRLTTTSTSTSTVYLPLIANGRAATTTSSVVLCRAPESWQVANTGALLSIGAFMGIALISTVFTFITATGDEDAAKQSTVPASTNETDEDDVVW